MRDTIEDILAIEWAGNAGDDMDGWQRVTDFIERDDTSMADKIKASQHLDLSFGEGVFSDAETEAWLLKHLAQRGIRGTLQ